MPLCPLPQSRSAGPASSSSRIRQEWRDELPRSRRAPCPVHTIPCARPSHGNASCRPLCLCPRPVTCDQDGPLKRDQVCSRPCAATAPAHLLPPRGHVPPCLARTGLRHGAAHRPRGLGTHSSLRPGHPYHACRSPSTFPQTRPPRGPSLPGDPVSAPLRPPGLSSPRTPDSARPARAPAQPRAAACRALGACGRRTQRPSKQHAAPGCAGAAPRATWTHAPRQQVAPRSLLCKWKLDFKNG